MPFEYFTTNALKQIIPIYDDMNNQIGKLYPREFCIRNFDSDCSIIFLSSSGKLTYGWIDFWNLPDYEHAFKDVFFAPYSKEYIEGEEYAIYKMRRTMNVYHGDGSRWEQVAAGMFVATNTCSPGENHVDWMEVQYVKRTDGKWIKVNGHGYGHGFVDTGFSIASGYSSIPLYGSW